MRHTHLCSGGELCVKHHGQKSKRLLNGGGRPFVSIARVSRSRPSLRSSSKVEVGGTNGSPIKLNTCGHAFVPVRAPPIIIPIKPRLWSSDGSYVSANTWCATLQRTPASVWRTKCW